MTNIRSFITMLFGIIAATLPAQTQLPDFVGCDYSGGKVFKMHDGKIVWSHKAPDSNDIWLLPNGNILFTTGKGVLEMTQQNDTVFSYRSDSNIFACQRLENGNTFVGECNTGRMLEIAPDGKIVRETSILPEGTRDAGFAFMRNARRLPNGHFLVAHYEGEKVCEYDRRGKLVWSVDVPGGAHSVARLFDGNTMVAVTDRNHNPRLVEFDRKGECVWEFSNKDLPGEPLKFLGGFNLLPDGNILITNWTGHESGGEKTHLLLINRNKEVIATLKDFPGITTMSSVHAVTVGNNTCH